MQSALASRRVIRSDSVASVARTARSASASPPPRRAATAASTSRWGGGTTRRPGHQLFSPKIEISPGISRERTSSVSISTPMTISSANSRNERSGTSASSAKLAASVRPATVIAPAACGVATATASRSRRVRASAQMRPATKTL